MAADVRLSAIIRDLRACASPENAEGMARFGIRSDHVLGISVAALRAMARTIGKDHALALDLWKTGIFEARVKKAVNWALRQIGKRNRVLHAAAVRAAEQIRTLDSPSARWIASDALREFRGDVVARKLERMEKKR